jgi:hypothetical protein
LALTVDKAILASRQDGWRSNPFKIKKVKLAIRASLNGNETPSDKILELAKSQIEY